jgi:hypothetical protein
VPIIGITVSIQYHQFSVKSEPSELTAYEPGEKSEERNLKDMRDRLSPLFGIFVSDLN